MRFQCKAILLIHTSAWVLSCNSAAYFQNTFFKELPWVAASEDRDFDMCIIKML